MVVNPLAVDNETPDESIPLEQIRLGNTRMYGSRETWFPRVSGDFHGLKTRRFNGTPR